MNTVPDETERAPQGKHLYVALFLLAMTLGSSWLAVSYYFQHENTRQLTHANTTTTSNNVTETYAKANELINYGNGTSVWYNSTNINPGQSFYNLTASVAIVDSYYSPGLGSHYVLAINRVVQNSTYFWTLWIYCSGANAWAPSAWGADYLLIEKKGLGIRLLTGSIGIGTDTLAWSFQRLSSTDPSSWQPPQPGTSKVSQCW